MKHGYSHVGILKSSKHYVNIVLAIFFAVFFINITILHSNDERYFVRRLKYTDIGIYKGIKIGNKLTNELTFNI